MSVRIGSLVVMSLLALTACGGSVEDAAPLESRDHTLRSAAAVTPLLVDGDVTCNAVLLGPDTFLTFHGCAAPDGTLDESRLTVSSPQGRPVEVIGALSGADENLVVLRTAHRIASPALRVQVSKGAVTRGTAVTMRGLNRFTGVPLSRNAEVTIVTPTLFQSAFHLSPGFHRLSGNAVFAGGALVGIAGGGDNRDRGFGSVRLDLHAEWIQQAQDDLALIPSPIDCRGLPATYLALRRDDGEFRGSADAECIVGTADADLIRAGGGDDIVYAMGGADRVWANAGDDLVYGGAGNDVLFGNTGRDTLLGQSGNDRLSSCAGNNQGCAPEGGSFLSGGVGRDRIFLTSGDVALGGPGHDEFEAYETTGEDGHIVGDSGDDVVSVLGRGFRVCGGQGRDDVTGAEGNVVFAGRNDVRPGAFRESAWGISDVPEGGEGYLVVAHFDEDDDGFAADYGWGERHFLCEPLPQLPAQRVAPVRYTGDCDDSDPDRLACD